MMPAKRGKETAYGLDATVRHASCSGFDCNTTGRAAAEEERPAGEGH
jgi:hypothetical protein